MTTLKTSNKHLQAMSNIKRATWLPTPDMPKVEVMKNKKEKTHLVDERIKEANGRPRSTTLATTTETETSLTKTCSLLSRFQVCVHRRYLNSNTHFQSTNQQIFFLPPFLYFHSSSNSFFSTSNSFLQFNPSAYLTMLCDHQTCKQS